MVILGATYPPGAPGFGTGAAPTLAAFDLRVVGSSTGDVLVATFRYPPDPDVLPQLLFYDARTGGFQPIRGSTRLPNSLLVDRDRGEIMVIFDDTSFPAITDLTGTRMIVSEQNRRPRVSVRGLPSRCVAGDFRIHVRIEEEGRLRVATVRQDGTRVKRTGRKRFGVRIEAHELSKGTHRIKVTAADSTLTRGSARESFRVCR